MGDKRRTQMIQESGFDLIRNPRYNKGSAFTEAERTAFHLHGLLPPVVGDLATQRARSYRVFQSKNSDLERYIYLRELQDSNETLFYSLLDAHITEMLPIVYTPTVGAGCQAYSHIYRRPRGLYLSYPLMDRIDEIFDLHDFDGIEAIVVSDGERI
jgi:malate dehydrogenase (oxaloacetate-decarboxylating)